ncbi:hypothetical protein BJ170DRAFT_55688 [Xylariales sp. AK1849]|nr:hypothetical protein BJ170DRAFT_55688 [Xylariales sp. AK1849]
MSRPLYHTVYKCARLPNPGSSRARGEVAIIKRLTREHNIPFVLLKTDYPPGLIYAESRDKQALRHWARALAGWHKRFFYCALEPTEAPVTGDRPTKLHGERFKAVKRLQEFGEVIRRGLYHWWSANKAFKKENFP